MKKKYLTTLFFVFSFLITFSALAQTESERKQIIKEYDLQKLEQLKSKAEQKAKKQKEVAKAKGFPTTIKKEDGSFSELQRLSSDGKPIYYSLDNTDAAESTRADYLNTGGGLGLNLDGQNMFVGVWDGGPTRPTHQEYGNRIVITDGNTALDGNSFHACHVTGTIGASGVQANAKGMAPQADVRTFDWNNDQAEAINQAANGLLLSNHSYGIPVANAPGAWFMGAYTQAAHDWDEIAYNAPYYLMVASAGNDGNTNNNQPTTAGYDKLNDNKNAKNNLVVANAQDANINGAGGLTSVNINNSSSEGPTDDFRVKPDITGNGTNVYSTYDNSNTAYNSISGTSMAAPNVTGTLLLLQQYYNQIYGNFMKSATLKGLATHTADDAGRPGPDAIFGWGLLNAKAAAETIEGNGISSVIEENSLSDGESYTLTVISDGSSPLLASITWTDLPGTNINTGTLNDNTPVLMNDLDIRIEDSSSNISYPWRLTSNATTNALRNGDNNVDNVERINIDNPAAGTYTITITHKGTLANPQDFSLVVTGVTSDFAMIPTNSTQALCTTDNLIYTFDYRHFGSTTTTLSTANLPTGTNINFSQSTLNSSNNTFTATVTGLNNLAPGNYEFDIIGDNGNETETKTVSFDLYSATVVDSNLLSPVNGSSDGGTTTIFSWAADVNAEDYTFEMATTPSFSPIVYTENVTTNGVAVSGMLESTNYYWRVRANNRCANGSFNQIFNLQVGTVDCSFSYNSTGAVPISDSADNSGGVYGDGWSTSLINVPDTFNVVDVSVTANIDHSYVDDLTIYLESPTAFNMLIDQDATCGDADDIGATFTDTGNTIVCGTNPAISGNVLPVTGFAVTYSGTQANGDWYLTTKDGYAGDDGSIDDWTLNLCSITSITTTPNFLNNIIQVDMNSTYGIADTDLLASTTSETAVQQEFILTQSPSVGTLTLNTTPLMGSAIVTLNVGDTFTQDDIDNNRLSYVNTETTDATDSFIIDVSNSTSGWLPNQVVNININNTLGVNDNVYSSFNVWPNPVTQGQLNISFNSLDNKDALIELFDIQGRKVLNSKIKSNSGITNGNLNVSQLSSGIYLMTINHSGFTSTKKIIIN